MELGECDYVAFSDFSMPCYAATCLLLPLNRNVAQDATLRLMYVMSRFWGSGKLTGKQCELMREQIPHQLPFYPVPFWSSGNLSGNQIGIRHGHRTRERGDACPSSPHCC